MGWAGPPAGPGCRVAVQKEPKGEYPHLATPAAAAGLAGFSLLSPKAHKDQKGVSPFGSYWVRVEQVLRCGGGAGCCCRILVGFLGGYVGFLGVVRGVWWGLAVTGAG